MARIHIKAEEPLKLYWADKLGLLIMEDIPCFWGDPLPETKAQFEVEMEQQIQKEKERQARIQAKRNYRLPSKKKEKSPEMDELLDDIF